MSYEKKRKKETTKNETSLAKGDNKIMSCLPYVTL
jgi:hypothetical protein